MQKCNPACGVRARPARHATRAHHGAGTHPSASTITTFARDPYSVSPGGTKRARRQPDCNPLLTKQHVSKVRAYQDPSRLRSHYLTEGRTRVKPGERAPSPSRACGCSSHATPQRTTRPSTVAYARPTPATAQVTPPHEEPTPLDTTQATNARERSRPV